MYLGGWIQLRFLRRQWFWWRRGRATKEVHLLQFGWDCTHKYLTRKHGLPSILIIDSTIILPSRWLDANQITFFRLVIVWSTRVKIPENTSKFSFATHDSRSDAIWTKYEKQQGKTRGRIVAGGWPQLGQLLPRLFVKQSLVPCAWTAALYIAIKVWNTLFRPNC